MPASKKPLIIITLQYLADKQNAESIQCKELLHIHIHFRRYKTCVTIFYIIGCRLWEYFRYLPNWHGSIYKIANFDFHEMQTYLRLQLF